MKRGTIFLALFVVIAAAIVGASQFLRNQPPIEITVAVDPLAEAWIRSAVDDFNSSEVLINSTRRVRITVSVISDLEVWGSQDLDWTPEDHPTAWMPASSVSVRYATSANLPFQTVTPSTARTPLVWGGYASRVAVLTGGGTVPLDWEQIVDAVETESWSALGGEESWRFVNLAFSLPDNTMSGVAVLFSGAASFNDTNTLGSDDVRGGYYDWFEPVIASVPNFNTIGPDVAAFVARGPAAADIGIGPESQWLNNLSGLTRDESVQFSYPAHPFVFDFPLAIWDDATTTDEQRDAVRVFGDWLLQAEQQASVLQHGLRPADGAPDANNDLFVDAQPYGIQLDPPLAETIQPPSLNDTQGLLSWFQRTRN